MESPGQFSAKINTPGAKKSSNPRKSSSPKAAAANLVVVRHEEPAGDLSLTGSISPSLRIGFAMTPSATTSLSR
jgi:hypothetical protein